MFDCTSKNYQFSIRSLSLKFFHFYLFNKFMKSATLRFFLFLSLRFSLFSSLPKSLNFSSLQDLVWDESNYEVSLNDTNELNRNLFLNNFEISFQCLDSCLLIFYNCYFELLNSNIFFKNSVFDGSSSKTDYLFRGSGNSSISFQVGNN